MSLYRSRQRKKDARSGEILNAALKVFVEKGFRAAKVEDIARAAGVTKGTPYLYFHNKEALFKAVVHDQLGACLAKMLNLTQLHVGNSKELLYKVIDVWWKEVGATEASGIFKVLFAEISKFSELATYFDEMVIKPTRDMTAAILQNGVDKGEFRPIDVSVVVDVLIGPILLAMLWPNSFSCIPGMEGGMNDPQRHIHHTLDIMLQGLSAKNH